MSQPDDSLIPQEDDGEVSFDWESIKERVFNPASREALIDAYDDWAPHYDEHLEELEYTAPELTVKELHRILAVEPDSLERVRILDVGCGTGLVAQELKKLGYSRIDGLDASAGMIAIARDSGLYQSIFQELLGTTLTIATATYDALICVGTFTISHVKVDALDEMIRITRIGGLLAFTIRGVYEEFKGRLDELFEGEVIEQLSRRSIFGQTRERCAMELFVVRVLCHSFAPFQGES